MTEFVGGRNVRLDKVTLEYDDCPGGPGTTWQVYQDQCGDPVVLRIVTDTEHADGVTEFRNGAEAAQYIEDFYTSVGYEPEDLAAFLTQLRELA